MSVVGSKKINCTKTEVGISLRVVDMEVGCKRFLWNEL